MFVLVWSVPQLSPLNKTPYVAPDVQDVQIKLRLCFFPTLQYNESFVVACCNLIFVDGNRLQSDPSLVIVLVHLCWFYNKPKPCLHAHCLVLTPLFQLEPQVLVLLLRYSYFVRPAYAAVSSQWISLQIITKLIVCAPYKRHYYFAYCIYFKGIFYYAYNNSNCATCKPQ